MIYFYVIVKLINILLFRCFILKLKQKFDSCKECKILKELNSSLAFDLVWPHRIATKSVIIVFVKEDQWF